MTGCPALFVEPESRHTDHGKPIRKVSFSLGVSFLSSRAMERQMKGMIKMLAEKFGAGNVTTVFHHSTSRNFLDTHNATARHLKGHLQFIDWLEANSFPYVDISGSAETMIEHYSGADLHVGYRVHAHILMSSLSKPSLLLAEDGRGKALKDVIGGNIFDAFEGASDGLVAKIVRRLRLFETMHADRRLTQEIAMQLEMEIGSNWQRTDLSRRSIDGLRDHMRAFMSQLP